MSSISRAAARIGLQKRIFLSVAVGLGLALAGFAILSLHLMNESTDRLLNQQLVIAEITARHVDSVLQDVAGQLQILAADGRLTPGDGRLDNDQQILVGAYSGRGFVSRLVLLDHSGRVLLAVPPGSLDAGLDYSNRPHVERALATGQSAFATAYSSVSSDHPNVAIATPVRDSAGRVTGLLSGEIDFGQRGVADFLRQIKVGKTGFVQLVDANGLILSTTEPSDPAAEAIGRKATTHPEHFADLIRDGQPVVRQCHTCHQTTGGLQRGRDVMAFAPLSTAPLAIALRLSEDDAFSSRRRLEDTVLFYSIGVLALGLLFAWLSTNAVVRPLEALTAAARRIGGGDLDSPVQVAGRPSVGETTTLAATLEAMRRRLGASYERIERWNRDLEERVAQRTRELSILFEVSQTLTRTVDVDALMQMVVEKIVSVLEAADAALFFYYDPDEEVLVPRAVVGYHFGPLQEVRLRGGEAMAGKVLQAGRTLIFANRSEVAAALANCSPQNEMSLRRAREGLAQPQASLGTPIIYQGKIAGVLLLSNLRQPGTFDSSDIAMVQAIADQMAVAIEHARLVKEAGQVQALREADRLKSEFLYSVSHELRTPLASVVSLVEVLAADYRTIPRRQLGRVLAIVERSATRLKDMVENLLDAGTIQAGRFRVQQQPVGLAGIVQEAMSCLLPLLEAKRQVVDIRLEEADFTVLADRNRIIQVLVNLVSNANKYCPEEQWFRLLAERKGESVAVSLADSGPGITAEDQAHLFEPFYRSARPLAVSGAGLGLAIVKAIVEAHGGDVVLESRPGDGTIVTFTLPLAPAHGSALALAETGAMDPLEASH